jgi:hypothetical protein
MFYISIGKSNSEFEVEYDVSFHGIWYMLGEIHCWYTSWFIGTRCMVVVLVVYH